MQRTIYGLVVILGLTLGFGIGILNATAQDLSMDEIKSLPGYKSYGTLSSFKKHLQKEPELYKAFKSNPAFSEKVLGSTNLQRQMLRDIKTSGNVKRVISQYGGPVSTNVQTSDSDYWTDERMRNAEPPQMGEVTPADEDKSETQRLDGDANLAAQQAIEQAQREREAAQKRAEEMIAKLREQKKLADEARVLRELAEAEAMMASLKEAFEGHPEAEADFFAHTELLQKVMDKELTLNDALVEAGITLEVSDSKDDDIIFDDGFEDNLKHVVGAYYKLGGDLIADLNHVPDDSLMAPDANGWPKYLNVPADCNPADSRVNYFHEFRSGSDQFTGDMDFVSYQKVMEGVSYVIGLTAEEAIAAPFFPRPAGTIQGFRWVTAQSKDALNDLSRDVERSISRCPNDFQQAPENCVGPLNTIEVLPLNAQRASVAKRKTCVLEPQKRYFFNMRPKIQGEVSASANEIPDVFGETLDKMAQAQASQGLNTQWADNITRRNGKVVNALRGTQVGLKHAEGLPPYVGPCVNSAPYPLTYNGSPQGVSYCGRQMAYNNILSDQNVACYDPYDKLPPQTFKKRGTGSTTTWVEGFGKPAYSRYVCETELLGDYPDKTYVCAAHRENQVRTRKEHSGLQLVNTLQQCQFDVAFDRFDWVNISSHVTNGSVRPRHMVYTPPKQGPAHRNVCRWNGESYPLGTVMTQKNNQQGLVTVDSRYYGKNKYVCEQRAEAPALPRFAHVDTGLDPIPHRVADCGNVSCGTFEVSFDAP